MFWWAVRLADVSAVVGGLGCIFSGGLGEALWIDMSGQDGQRSIAVGQVTDTALRMNCRDRRSQVQHFREGRQEGDDRHI